MPTLRTPNGPIEFERTPYEPSKSWIHNHPPRFLGGQHVVGGFVATVTPGAPQAEEAPGPLPDRFELDPPDAKMAAAMSGYDLGRRPDFATVTDNLEAALALAGPPATPSDPIAELGRGLEAWRGVARQRADEVIELQRVIGLQNAVLEAQGTNIAERDHVIAMQKVTISGLEHVVAKQRAALSGLGISHDRAVARVAELEHRNAVLAGETALQKIEIDGLRKALLGESPPTDRASQDAAVRRWASR